jgi:hypothetical protein
MSRDPRAESHITTDSRTVEKWEDSEPLVPVQFEQDGQERLAVVHESDVESDYQELSWDEFEREIRAEDKLIIQHSDTGTIDVIDRSDAVSHAAVDEETVEQKLSEGETVETELSERTVVEHVIVEEATIESEVVDKEELQSTIVEASLLSTEVTDCSAERTEVPNSTGADESWFESGTRVSAPHNVEIDVDEEWELEREVVERLTVESRIVDTDVATDDTIETETLRETVDIDGVTRTILDGELVGSPETAIDHGHVESHFREDDIIETRLFRRQTRQEKMHVQRTLTGEILNTETMTADTISQSIVQSEVIEEGEYDIGQESGERAVGTETSASDETGTDNVAETSRADVDENFMVSDHDEGKPVEDRKGTKLGIVVEVVDGQLWVDPDPSITDRIQTALGWGEHDEDSYPIHPDHIARIDDDKVVLMVDGKDQE